MNNQTVSNDDKQKKRGGLILLLILLLAILLGSGIWIYNKNKSYNTASNGTSGVVSWNDIEEESFDNYLKKIQQDAKDSMFSVEINSSPMMESGSKTAKLMIQNRPTNRYNMSVTIKRKSTGSVLYKLDNLLPNHYILTADINESLPDGEHPAVATFQALDPQTGKVLQTVNVDLIFKVGK